MRAVGRPAAVNTYLLFALTEIDVRLARLERERGWAATCCCQPEADSLANVTDVIRLPASLHTLAMCVPVSPGLL